MKARVRAAWNVYEDSPDILDVCWVVRSAPLGCVDRCRNDTRRAHAGIVNLAPEDPDASSAVSRERCRSQRKQPEAMVRALSVRRGGISPQQVAHRQGDDERAAAPERARRDDHVPAE